MYQIDASERYTPGEIKKGFSVAKSFSGAPAIAIVAALALAVELDHKKHGKFPSLELQCSEH